MKIKIDLFLVGILMIAGLFRIYRLSEVPFGFHVDEVKVGWNAYSLNRTGEDDWGIKWPLYYNSFGDYRPTGIIYLTMPFVVFFGKTIFATRIASALFGALSCFAIYMLVKSLMGDKKKARWAALLLAINPWHIAASRATSEVVISMCLVILGLYFWSEYLKNKVVSKLVWSLGLAILSYFFYHSSRLLVPIFFLGFGCFFYDQRKKISLTIFIVLTGVTGIFALNPMATGRFSQVSIANSIPVKHELDRMPFEEGDGRVIIARVFHNKLVVYARSFVEEYLKYLSPGFFVGENTKPERYGTAHFGLITFGELILFLAGMLSFSKNKSVVGFVLLLIAGALPAAMTIEDSPNIHRSLYMLPSLIILETIGLFEMMKYKKIFACILFLIFVHWTYFWHMYFVHNIKGSSALSRNSGAIEVSKYVIENMGKYDLVYLTNRPDRLYPWMAFFGNWNPEIFNKEAKKRDKEIWRIDNLVFSEDKCPAEKASEYNTENKKVLFVNTAGCNESLELKQVVKIKRPDESSAYILWSNNIK